MQGKRKLFGTDGVRGQANAWPITPDVIMSLAMAAGSEFIRGDHRHTVVIGKDTRLSGYMVESALTSGFTAVGFHVMRVGPLPTPAVALLTKSLRADLGVMVSASHNPYPDNGIKFFGPDGYKLSDATEQSIEKRMSSDFDLAAFDHIGKAKTLDDATGRYIEFAKSTFPKHLRLDGLKIVVDCAHGAAYKAAPAVLWELGADIIPIGTHPNGTNINDKCGATSLDLAKQTLLEHHADLAIILDGDADRIIMIDSKGRVLDGDKILALTTSHFIKTKRLRGDAVIATHMSNLGLERYLKSIGLNLIRTNIGDRYVIDAMRKLNCNIGGEQSGHIILHDYTTTGDGLIAALQVLAIMQREQKPLFELSHIYENVPQIQHNLRLSSPVNLNDDMIKSMIRKAEEKIGSSGHLLVRASGTEPVLRLMAQGDNKDILDDVLSTLSDYLKARAA
ncbi:MAG: phosphoglucosamine mutase [Alphaproteobacteria bacterium]|nr:phosphoglucosamine mutase [Alphaproteobacteria bacterium]